MFKGILIATDGSECAAKATGSGLQLAKSLGARAVALTATEPWPTMVNAKAMGINFPSAEYETASKAEAARILGEVYAQSQALGVDCELLHVTDFPADAIIAAAKANACDLIVMASHGRRGVRRLLLGSQATKVVALSSVPVLVCR